MNLKKLRTVGSRLNTVRVANSGGASYIHTLGLQPNRCASAV
jgi:hypothetical protein